MIDIDFTHIDNSKLIGRLLPWWARGRRIALFMQAILSPLASAHRIFQQWALEKYIECHITAQKASLEWYLKYCLKSHFRNEDDCFYISNGINNSVCCFSTEVWRNGLHWDNELRWSSGKQPEINLNTNLSCFNTGVWENNMLWNNNFVWENYDNARKYDDEYLEAPGKTNVYAPAIVDTVAYDHEDYERDIRNIMSRFMINFNKINIIIAST